MRFLGKLFSVLGLFGGALYGSGTLLEVKDPLLTGSATPNQVYGDDAGFFITNNVAITGANQIVGWFYVSGSSIIEVKDPNTLSSAALPYQVYGNGNGEFFITNNESITTGGLIGWYYTSGSTTVTEVTDPGLSGAASPYQVFANGNGDFFISSNASFSTTGGLVGWYYVPGDLTATEVTDPLMPPNTALPTLITANGIGEFFITSNTDFSGINGLVGWVYTPGSLTAVEVTDSAAPVSSVTPYNVAGNQNNFFIVNHATIMGSGGVVGWYYASGMTATEIKDSSFTGSANLSYIAVNGSGNFFIVGDDGLMANRLVGWYYNGSSILEVRDPLNPLPFGEPNGIAVNSKGDFFIANANGYDIANSTVGWYYTPGLTTISEVVDPLTPSSAIGPNNVSVNCNGDFFVTSYYGLSPTNGVIGLSYVAGSTTATEVSDPLTISGTPANVSSSGSNFFISNNQSIGVDGIVGWLYIPPSTSNPRSYHRPNNRRGL